MHVKPAHALYTTEQRSRRDIDNQINQQSKKQHRIPDYFCRRAQLLGIARALECHHDQVQKPQRVKRRQPERDVVIGDLLEGYGLVLDRFNKRRADIWFYKQVAGSVLPLLRRTLLRIGALVWLGRILRRLIS